MAYSKYPPEQLLYFVQDVKYCSDRFIVLFLNLFSTINLLYAYPVAAKAQHDPQLPWDFTLVTHPNSLQSKLTGAPSRLSLGDGLAVLSSGKIFIRFLYWLIYALDQSVILLTPGTYSVIVINYAILEL